ncbi:MAG: hypothetical protein ABIP79_07945 [Chitinophagaceae bacterium]
MSRSLKIVLSVCILIIVIGIAVVSLSMYKYYTNSPLKAFRRINDSLEANNKKYNIDFNYFLSDSSTEYLKLHDAEGLTMYNDLNKELDSLTDYINDLKMELINTTEQKSGSNSKDNIANTTNPEGLKEKIRKYYLSVNDLVAHFSLTPRKLGSLDNIEENGEMISWEKFNFDGLPLAGAITNLSQIGSDMQNIQSGLKIEIENKRTK